MNTTKNDSENITIHETFSCEIKPYVTSQWFTLFCQRKGGGSPLWFEGPMNACLLWGDMEACVTKLSVKETSSPQSRQTGNNGWNVSLQS